MVGVVVGVVMRVMVVMVVGVQSEHHLAVHQAGRRTRRGPDFGRFDRPFQNDFCSILVSAALFSLSMYFGPSFTEVAPSRRWDLILFSSAG